MARVFDGEGIGRRRAALLTALGLVLLALVYFTFLRGGDAPSEETSPSAPESLAQAESSEDPFEPQPGSGDTKAPIETYEVFASRDPFSPVVQNGSDGAGVDPGEGGDAGAGGQGGASGAADEGSQSAQANNEEVEGHAVTLVDVFREGGENKVQIEVDANGYTVSEDEVFAENFQLVSTSGDCATLLYGDDQFTLCEGEEILK